MKFEFFFEIIFHSWTFLSNSLLTHEHCRLVILEGMSTSFKPPLSNLLIRVFSLIFDLLWSQINSLCISFYWVIVELSKTVTEARCIVLEIANVLKIVIFPSRVKFLIIQIFKRDFQNMIFEVLFIFKFSVVRRMNSKNFHCVS